MHQNTHDAQKKSTSSGHSHAGSHTLPMTSAVHQRKALGQAIQKKKEAMMENYFPGGIPSGIPTLQRKDARSSKGLPESVKGKMESAIGTDFSTVQLHAESSQAVELGALAYTQGEDIHFAKGQYDTGSQQGQTLLGHELTHVVQQRAGRVQATTHMKGVGVSDDSTLEREADAMGGYCWHDAWPSKTMLMGR